MRRKAEKKRRKNMAEVCLLGSNIRPKGRAKKRTFEKVPLIFQFNLVVSWGKDEDGFEEVACCWDVFL